MDTVYIPGDFIVTHGSDFFDKMIQIFTHSHWNHAALITSAQGDIIELVGKGIRKNTIQEYQQKQRYVVHVDMSEEDRSQVIAYAQYMLSKHDKYGFLTIASIAVKILTRSRFVIKLDGTLICSEFVARALEQGGIIWPKDPSLITPADVYNYFEKEKVEPLSSRSRTRTEGPDKLT